MGENRAAPFIIGGLVVILIVVIIASVAFLKGDKDKDENDPNKQVEAIAPVLNLELSTTDPDQESVIINATATTEDEGGIDYIVLPDGTEIYADSKEYEVKENGKYTFQVYGVNGASSTLDIDVKNIREISANNPYMPEGFEYVGGEVDTGYVIQDAYGNQYVWVPVPTAILTRTTLMNREYSEASIAHDLSNSVGKYYGFYIARFEASMYEADGNIAAASMSGKIPWTDIAYQDAYNASLNTAIVFGYEGVETALVNSYAWDTTLAWLDKTVTNYSSNTSYGNYSGTIYPTGHTESDIINNICDMAGNVREWTTEIYIPVQQNTKKNNNKNKEELVSRVVRGGSASINTIANSRNGYPEELVDNYWGFRTILYKQ